MNKVQKISGAIFSALGRESFTQEQRLLLETSLDLTYHPVTEEVTFEELVFLAKGASVLGITRRLTKDLNRKLLSSLPDLKGLAVYSTGFEWMDTDYLEEKKIHWCYLKDYSAATVAEHTLGMLLMLSRRMVLSYPVSEGWLPKGISLRGFELEGKTAGIVGAGEIGGRVSQLLQGMRMRVLYTDPDSRRIAAGFRVSLETLLTESDVIILCLPKKRGSDFFIGPSQLAQMKPGCLLLNPARASLVDHESVLNALRNKSLYGYAVDDELECLKSPSGIEPGRILQTRHTAWYSDEAMKRGTQAWTENIAHLANLIKEERKL